MALLLSLLCPCSRGGRRREEGKHGREKRENQKGISPMRLQSGSKSCVLVDSKEEPRQRSPWEFGAVSGSPGCSEAAYMREARTDCRNHFG